jgi:serine/threonine protein kinase
MDDLSIRLIWRDICQGLEFLHHNEIIHCDIKEKNILIDENGGAVIADFDISLNSENRTQTFKGTPIYIAPGKKFKILSPF